jgi:hypothetical protein
MLLTSWLATIKQCLVFLWETIKALLSNQMGIQNILVNLFSFTKALETKGVQLSSKVQLISLKIGTREIFFDKVFKHGSGRLLGIEIHPIPNHIAATGQTLNINTAHNMFGHPNSQVLAATASKYGFKTKNKLDVCSNCAVPKAKQKNLSKTNSHPST